MAHNYLEQLVAEWYEYRGYFVRRNVWVGLRAKGGYECEIDVVAFHPEKKHLVQIEPSMDTNSWEKREKRYRAKFDAGKRHIPTIFSGFTLPPKLDQIALLNYASTANHTKLGGGRVQLVPELLTEILSELRQRSVKSQAVPEQFIILRTLQFVAENRKSLQKFFL